MTLVSLAVPHLKVPYLSNQKNQAFWNSTIRNFNPHPWINLCNLEYFYLFHLKSANDIFISRVSLHLQIWIYFFESFDICWKIRQPSYRARLHIDAQRRTKSRRKRICFRSLHPAGSVTAFRLHRVRKHVQNLMHETKEKKESEKTKIRRKNNVLTLSSAKPLSRNSLDLRSKTRSRVAHHHRTQTSSNFRNARPGFRQSRSSPANASMDVCFFVRAVPIYVFSARVPILSALDSPSTVERYEEKLVPLSRLFFFVPPGPPFRPPRPLGPARGFTDSWGRASFEKVIHKALSIRFFSSSLYPLRCSSLKPATLGQPSWGLRGHRARHPRIKVSSQCR